MSSELLFITTSIGSNMSISGTTNTNNSTSSSIGTSTNVGLKPALISACWSHEDLNQYFTKSMTVIQPSHKKSLDTNSIHERDMHARMNLQKVPITIDTTNLTSRNRVSSISPVSRNNPGELTPIIEKENKRTKAKRILKELLANSPLKKSSQTKKNPSSSITTPRKTSVIIKCIGICAALNILGVITLAAIVTFVLPNLFMSPTAYVSVSSKQHLLHEDASLY